MSAMGSQLGIEIPSVAPRSTHFKVLLISHQKGTEKSSKTHFLKRIFTQKQKNKNFFSSSTININNGIVKKIFCSFIGEIFYVMRFSYAAYDS